MIRKIIKFPAPSLRRPCEVVAFPLSEEVLEHIRDLKDTLAATPNGMALASNQILAEGMRVFVVRPVFGLPEVVINPEWEPTPVAKDGETGFEYSSEFEGCLSVPELNMMNIRYDRIELHYWDESGRESVLPALGLAARIIQHECDHLQGKLLYDYADPRTQIRVRTEAIKNRKAGRW